MLCMKDIKKKIFNKKIDKRGKSGKENLNLKSQTDISISFACYQRFALKKLTLFVNKQCKQQASNSSVSSHVLQNPKQM